MLFPFCGVYFHLENTQNIFKAINKKIKKSRLEKEKNKVKF